MNVKIPSKFLMRVFLIPIRKYIGIFNIVDENILTKKHSLGTI